MVELLEEGAARKGIVLLAELPDDLPGAVLGDPTRLRQVLFNLVGNAVKFTDRGHVTVRAGQLRQPDGAAVLRFEVEDSGIGIDAEAQARLFQRFSQADGSTARRYGGTGLGLAISRELVGLMGGEIGVESAPGQGSRFWFTVPLPPGHRGDATRRRRCRRRRRQGRRGSSWSRTTR